MCQCSSIPHSHILLGGDHVVVSSNKKPSSKQTQASERSRQVHVYRHLIKKTQHEVADDCGENVREQHTKKRAAVTDRNPTDANLELFKLQL